MLVLLVAGSLLWQVLLCLQSSDNFETLFEYLHGLFMIGAHTFCQSHIHVCLRNPLLDLILISLVELLTIAQHIDDALIVVYRLRIRILKEA